MYEIKYRDNNGESIFECDDFNRTVKEYCTLVKKTDHINLIDRETGEVLTFADKGKVKYTAETIGDYQEVDDGEELQN